MADPYDAYFNGTYTPPSSPQQAPAPTQQADPYDTYFSPQPTQPAPRTGDGQPFGELKPADESWTDWATHGTMRFLERIGMQPQYVRHMGEGLVGIGSMTPAGALLSGAEFTRDAPRIFTSDQKLKALGDTVLDAIGAAPLAIGASRIARGYPTVRTAATPTLDELRGAAREGTGMTGPGSGGYRAVENAPLEYHPDAMEGMTDFARRTMESARLPQPGAGVFSPEKAPEVYATLGRFDRGFPYGGTRPVAAHDIETLRQQLRGFEGPSGPAGEQAIHALDAYMMRPPPGMLTRGTPADIAEARANLQNARGNYRAYKTSEGVEDAISNAEVKAAVANSGKNRGNAIRQELRKLDLGGATDAEREALINAAIGDRTTNWLRSGSNLLGGGGGLGRATSGGIAGAAGHGIATALGLDPVTAAAVGVGTASASAATGVAMRNAANARTLRAAEEVAADIRRNSPLYRAREATSPPITDPRSLLRDAIAVSMLPQAAQQGKDWWNRQFVPYENR